MAVRIRLARHGFKKRPHYAIVVIDGEKKRNGAYLERLGYYKPGKDGKDDLRLNLEALQAWQAKGAQVSERVGHLVKSLSK